MSKRKLPHVAQNNVQTQGEYGKDYKKDQELPEVDRRNQKRAANGKCSQGYGNNVSCFQHITLVFSQISLLVGSAEGLLGLYTGSIQQTPMVHK